MALNNVGNQSYDAKGLPEGTLLTANDIGTNRYDASGMTEGGIGTAGGVRLLAILGVGI